MKKKILAINLILIIVLILGACTSKSIKKEVDNHEKVPSNSQNKEPLEIVIAQPADAQNLDPQTAGGPYAGNPSYNIFESLVFFTPEGNLIPQLATEWKQTSEKTWEFKLREDVTFHNGEKFNSDACVYTFDRMFSDSTRKTYGLRTLESWRTIDEYTFEVTTKGIDLQLPNKMADASILPPVYTEEVGEEKFAFNPVGTGAYKLLNWELEKSIVLERYESYYGKKPAVEKITFIPIPEASTRTAELLTGNVDIILDVNSEIINMINSSDNASIEYALGKRIPFVGINLLDYSDDILKNKLIRQAMNYSIDKKAICDSVLGGYSKEVANFFREDHPGYDGSIEPYPYNPEKAKELLAEAGYPNGFEITMQTSPNIILQGLEVSQAIVSYLEAVGIKVNLESLELNTYRNIVIGGQEQEKTAGLYLWNWGTKPTEISSILDGVVRTGGITSYFSNSEFDELFDKAANAKTIEERDALYKKIQQKLIDEAPFIFLYQQGDLYGKSNRIKWSPRLDQYILGIDIADAR